MYEIRESNINIQRLFFQVQRLKSQKSARFSNDHIAWPWSWLEKKIQGRDKELAKMVTMAMTGAVRVW